MTPEEKTVVDEFQGEAAYEQVVAKADYYLMDSASLGVKLLGSGVSDS